MHCDTSLSIDLHVVSKEQCLLSVSIFSIITASSLVIEIISVLFRSRAWLLRIKAAIKHVLTEFFKLFWKSNIDVINWFLRDWQTKTLIKSGQVYDTRIIREKLSLWEYFWSSIEEQSRNEYIHRIETKQIRLVDFVVLDENLVKTYAKLY